MKDAAGAAAVDDDNDDDCKEISFYIKAVNLPNEIFML